MDVAMSSDADYCEEILPMPQLAARNRKLSGRRSVEPQVTSMAEEIKKINEEMEAIRDLLQLKMQSEVDHSQKIKKLEEQVNEMSKKLEEQGSSKNK